VAKLGVAVSRVIPAANLSRTLPPVLPPNFISRKEILDGVEIDKTGITLVVAPAGYGKTSLVAEYITTLEHPVIWLSFNDSDDTKSFNSNFVQAVRNVIPEFGKWFSSSQVLTTAEIMTEVFSELGSLGGHFVLVLDDDRVSPGDTAPLATHLFSSVPKNVHVIILRRVIPSEAFVQLKALNNLQVIDQNKMKFSEEEVSIAALIVGVSIERPEYKQMLEKLNGWPAGVHLILNNISRGWDGSLSASEEREISSGTNFLVENLLSTLKPVERKILESLAVVEEFSIEEAEIILQNAFSLSKLNRFAVDGLLLKYSSDPINKYSFNTIVRNGLILNPTIADKELRQIHQRLCDHFADRGSYLKALEHAKFAGSPETIDTFLGTVCAS
jgi:ATP/maltotriose-dependent transcriptional regulator MalT